MLDYSRHVYKYQCLTHQFIPLKKGLQRGNPLSSFLFVLAAKVLNRLLNRAFEKGLIEGIKVGSDDVWLSHFQFANNMILLCLANIEVLYNFRHIFDCFIMMSSLKINYEKSTLIPLNYGKE